MEVSGNKGSGLKWLGFDPGWLLSAEQNSCSVLQVPCWHDIQYHTSVHLHVRIVHESFPSGGEDLVVKQDKSWKHITSAQC